MDTPICFVGLASPSLFTLSSSSKLPEMTSTFQRNSNSFMKSKKSTRTFSHSLIKSAISQSIESVHPIEHDSDSDENIEVVIHTETYGCAMNIADTQVIHSLILSEFSSFSDKITLKFTENESEATVFLINTCAIREKAEIKVIQRLKYLNTLRNRRLSTDPPQIICVLGCMAEHMKKELLDPSPLSQLFTKTTKKTTNSNQNHRLADIVLGPDSYRALPFAILNALCYRDSFSSSYNVQLSTEETYADVAPVRKLHSKDGDVSAFVNVMRGCDNACTFCVVPRTRGRERSRPMDSIVSEVQQLSHEGFKEVVLLGQNVNSYNDLSVSAEQNSMNERKVIKYSSEGFSSRYGQKDAGKTFAELLWKVSEIDDEMRIRFTSPHPKDYPMELIEVMNSRNNLCKQVHVPLQSGSTLVLDRMKRGYSREVYIELVESLREQIPNVALSTDIICGFCGETEKEFEETIELMKKVQFEQAFLYAYSERDGTPAAKFLIDDVNEDVKQKRLSRMIEVFHECARTKNEIEEIGRNHLVLIDGEASKRIGYLSGRTDTNKRVIFKGHSALKAGDYVEVQIQKSSSLTLTADFIKKSSIKQFFKTSQNITMNPILL
eukprot:CAMPEP_0182445744 /NCGR_PEP_ID=MMETSP1172-20130603/3766_1 /TAXON_ID=708627 /ORGANISM="Timspurckia oligopyrenoides, Strain CCMP3278" /LENGTH=606 /DNA_ID=CAMNT_0024641567 /DNA_START=1350 /DNA_END=3170 /DNA_ORIENTATION=+